MLAALVAAPGPWTAGYVSEAGTAGQPLAGAYRAGLVVLAGGVALLAAPLGRVRRAARPLLAAAAVLAAVSGTVPCTRGCPLPPYQATTPADVVHTAASALGMLALLAAAALVATTPTGPPADPAWPGPARTVLRRLSAAAVALLVPPGAALLAVMLLAGRTTTGALLERVVLVTAVAWLVGAACLTATRRPARVPGWTPSTTGSPPWSTNSTS